MNRSMTFPVSAFSPTEIVLWSWLVFGAVAIALIPQARGVSPIGWLPFWFVIAPLMDLAFVHREQLLRSLSEPHEVRPRRRRPAAQARTSRRRRMKSSPARAAIFEV